MAQRNRERGHLTSLRGDPLQIHQRALQALQGVLLRLRVFWSYVEEPLNGVGSALPVFSSHGSADFVYTRFQTHNICGARQRSPCVGLGHIKPAHTLYNLLYHFAGLQQPTSQRITLRTQFVYK